MADENGSFTGFIDFENMLWGIDFDSFGVIIERYTKDKPRLLKSFLTGYGFEDNEKNGTKLNILMLNMAMVDITYGHSMKDERLFMLGSELLKKVKRAVLEGEKLI